MVQTHRPVMTHRRLLLFKWLMIFIPAGTVAVGHSLLEHAGVAQLVAHLLLRLDTIKELVEADRPQEAEAELERLHGVADEIYEDIGESIAGLRTNVTERGLVHALQDYMDQFEERHRIPTSLRTDDAAGQLPHLSPL